MSLQDLKVNNVRNLKQVEINPAQRVNIIYGANASGKSSLLESIFLLARGKSFRTHNLANVINIESSTFSVSSRITSYNSHATNLGVEHRDGRLRMKAEGVFLKRTSDLANHLPLIIIDQECHQLLNLGPRCRRRFLDWGVFHVEPIFLSVWRRYGRALKQRNALLQRNDTAVPSGPWSQELEISAERLHAFRLQYVQQFTRILERFVCRLLEDDVSLSIDYMRGWSSEEDLATTLSRTYSKDKALGYTQFGPHRADLRICMSGRPVQEVLSRGQQKLLIYAMYLAQASLYQELKTRPSILLADDACAELDKGRMMSLLQLIEDLDVQVFLTMIERYKNINIKESDQKMFHVEHGIVKEVV